MIMAAIIMAMIGPASSASIPIPIQSGIASVYTTRTNRGARTASGRPLRDHELTAAHRTLRFGTKVKVTNKRNGKSVVVTITDRGPFIRGRVIDLSMAGARAIGMGFGLAPVYVFRLGQRL